MTQVYTETEIINIQEEGFNFTLPKSCIDIIAKISEEVGAPSYVRTPTFPKPIRKKKMQTQSSLLGN